MRMNEEGGGVGPGGWLSPQRTIFARTGFKTTVNASGRHKLDRHVVREDFYTLELGLLWYEVSSEVAQGEIGFPRRISAGPPYRTPQPHPMLAPQAPQPLLSLPLGGAGCVGSSRVPLIPYIGTRYCDIESDIRRYLREVALEPT